MTAEQAVAKTELSEALPSGIEKYDYLQEIWEQEYMSSFKYFLRWPKNKDDVPILEARRKLIAFYNNKNKDMLKPGCTVLHLAKSCLHKPTATKFYPFTKGEKDLVLKLGDDHLKCSSKKQ